MYPEDQFAYVCTGKKHVSLRDFVLSLFPQAKKIAKAGQEFARNNLMGDDIFCYYFKLFQVSIF